MDYPDKKKIKMKKKTDIVIIGTHVKKKDKMKKKRLLIIGTNVQKPP